MLKGSYDPPAHGPGGGVEGEGKWGSVRALVWGRREGDGVICAASSGKGGLDKAGGLSSI